MDSKLVASDGSLDIEFNTIAFEKKLTSLKDSQDSINSCCHWCLQNRQHHKKIVSSWLNVLKRVKIEHRLTLFYLANDVIQYSKRRNYDFVESWGTTLQKATTMVRDEKIKNKILRIFKIWEERAIYGEEFITDLSGLISASPSIRKGDETHEFQSSYLIQKIRVCSKLENDTDTKLNQLKEHNPKIQIDTDLLISSLKDRAHVDDVEKELDEYTKQMDNYINALKHEIKSRIQVISLLSQAETQLENDKKDVKLVTTAYRTFAVRVKNLKKKLDEKIPTLSSPIPSPDVNAPSPSSDSDIDLPISTTVTTVPLAPPLPVTSEVLFTNPGYYNPVPPPDIDSSFNQGNNFSSFIGSNMSFTLGSLNTSSLFSGNKMNSTSIQGAQTTTSYSINNTISSLFPSIACPPPPPSTDIENPNYQFGAPHAPLLPPPMPPFSKSEDSYGNSSYTESYGSNNSTFNFDASNTSTYPTQLPDLAQPPPVTSYEPFHTTYSYPNSDPSVPSYEPLPLANPGLDDYNPAEELETWEPEPGWEPPPIVQDTPDSPPMSEKTGYTDPVEYREEVMYGASDVDHRVLPSVIKNTVTKDGKNLHHKDVDHRNLISLTGSPSEGRSTWSNKSDQDFRNPVKQAKTSVDQDYRVPFIESMKLPPPPPPPKALTNDSTDSQFNSNYNSNTNTFNLSSSSNTYSNTDTTNLNLNSGTDNYSMESNYINSNTTPISFPIEYPPRLTNPTQIRNKLLKKIGVPLRKFQDNVESIDMDLSDDNENEMNFSTKDMEFEDCFEPPSDLFDDVDANNFLDNVNENLDLEDLVMEDMESMDRTNNEEEVNFVNPIFSVPPPLFEKPPNINDVNTQEPPPNWKDRNFNQDALGGQRFNQDTSARNDFGTFRGRGNVARGNFNNTIVRGNWGNNNNRGTSGQRGGMRGGTNFRGFVPRGRGRGRGFRGRGRGDGTRGRGDFRGRADFRNVRGGY